MTQIQHDLFYRLVLGAMILVLGAGACRSSGTKRQPTRAAATKVAPKPKSAPQGLCSPSGWCWQNPLPFGDDMNAVWGTASDHVIAVGQGGLIVQFDGSSWSAQPSGTRRDLLAVWGWRPTRVLAGGERILLSSNGRRWTTRLEDEHQWFIDIRGFGPDKLVRTSPIDVALSKDRGRTWNRLGPRLPGMVGGLWGTGPDLLVVGSTQAIHRWDGSRWAATKTPPVNTAQFESGQVNAVWGTDPRNLFLGTDKGMLRLHNLNWSARHGKDVVYSVTGWRNGNVVGVGDTIVEFINDTWRVHKTPERLRSVWGPHQDDLVAVGKCGHIMRRSKRGWSQYTRRLTNSASGVVWTPTGQAIVVGAVTLTFDGKRWRKDESAAPVMTAVAVAAGGVVVAVSAGGVLHRRNKGSWTAVHGMDSSIPPINALWATANLAIGVGNAGTIVHYQNGKRTVHRIRSSVFFKGIWGSSPTDVFAVGEKGSILHFNGTAWSPQPSGVTSSIDAVWGTSPTNVYAMADELLHYDGKRWSPVKDFPPGESGKWGRGQAVVWGSGPNDIFVAGWGHSVAHYDGRRWSVQDAGTAQRVSAGASNKRGDSLMVGNKCGSILLQRRHNRPRP